jgi:hypothetical protein
MSSSFQTGSVIFSAPLGPLPAKKRFLVNSLTYMNDAGKGSIWHTNGSVKSLTTFKSPIRHNLELSLAA